MVDVNQYYAANNNHCRWILVCVDYFSGKVFARGMRNKTGATMRTNFEAIMTANHTVPHIVQGDGEFSQGEFLASCIAHDITMIPTNPYSPTSNGMVERANREVRKLIRAGFVRNNNFRWSQYLAQYIANINSQRKARTKQCPNDLWTQGYHPLPPGHVPVNGPLNDDNTLQEKQDIHNEYLDERTNRLLQTGAVAREFQVNDNVRIRLENVSNKMRERTKSKMSLNLNAIHFTPEVYTVYRVRDFEGPRPPEYYIRDAGNNIVRSGVVPKVFYGSDLLFVPPGSVAVSINPATVDRAQQINRLRN